MPNRVEWLGAVPGPEAPAAEADILHLLRPGETAEIQYVGETWHVAGPLRLKAAIEAILHKHGLRA